MKPDITLPILSNEIKWLGIGSIPDTTLTYWELWMDPHYWEIAVHVTFTDWMTWFNLWSLVAAHTIYCKKPKSQIVEDAFWCILHFKWPKGSRAFFKGSYNNQKFLNQMQRLGAWSSLPGGNKHQLHRSLITWYMCVISIVNTNSHWEKLKTFRNSRNKSILLCVFFHSSLI